MKILDQMVLVYIASSCWAGRKKLMREDLRSAGNDIPPQALASLGSKYVFPKEKLVPFHTLTRRAERACLAVGSRFMGGFAIPLSKRHEVTENLIEIRSEYDRELKGLIEGYDASLAEHLAKYPQWSEIIRKAVVPREEVAGRFGFRFNLCQAKEVEDLPEMGGLAAEVQGLHAQVMREVAVMAKQMQISGFTKNQDATQRTLNPLRAIYGKVVCMSFTNPKLVDVAERIEAALTALPPTGKLDATDMEQVVKLVAALADPDTNLDMTRYPSALKTGVLPLEVSLPVASKAKAPLVYNTRHTVLGLERRAVL